MKQRADAAELLIAKGREVLAQRRLRPQFSGSPEADALLSDLRGHSHAFVIACIMDRQIKAERAWLIPYRFQQALGTFAFDRLRRLRQRTIYRIMTFPEPMHRFPQDMSRNFYEAVQMIAEEYDGNASRLWSGRPSSAEVVFRFLQFRGVGPKIATMAANLLVRQLKIKLRDYYSIDVSVDVHVRRVLTRLGLIAPGASESQIIYKARSISPEFPGLIDFAAWEVGRTWCRPNLPRCNGCYLKAGCPIGSAA